MTETFTSVVFLTQSRVASDARTDAWNDTCNGHGDIYEALTCLETTRASCDGRDQSPKGRRLFEFVKASLVPYGANARVEFRVVRRTVTALDEVVDGVGAELTESGR